MRKLITILCLCSFVIARGQTWSYSYWLDANTEQQQTGTYTGNALQLDIPTDGLSDWFHTLHIQVTDAEGKSSPVLTRIFAIVPQSTTDRTPARYRYWFDNDEASMQTGTMAGNTFAFDMPVATLSNWLHTMHYQVQDVSGQWSPVLTRTFAVIPQETVANRDLTGQPYRYWFDDNETAMQTGTLAGNALELEVAVEQLPQGFHYLYLQVQDDLGNWSPALAKEFMVGMEDILPWGTEEPWESKYVFTDNRDNYADPEVDANGRNWTELEYDDSQWQTLTGPMSNTQNRWDIVGYIWEGDNNCFNLRRTFSMDSVPEGKYQLLMHHDDGVRVYLNGQKVVEDETYGNNYTYEIPRSAFVVGQNILAIYVEDKSGGQCLDYCLRYTEIARVQQIVLNESSIELEGGKRFTLTATVLPDAVEDKSVTWSVADDSIASVSQNGVVRGLKMGTTTVTVTSVANPDITASCTVTVTSDKPESVGGLPNVPFEFFYNAADYDEITHSIPNHPSATLAEYNLQLSGNLPDFDGEQLTINQPCEGYIDRWEKFSRESGSYFYRQGQDNMTIIAKVKPKLNSGSCDFISNRAGGYNYMLRVGSRNGFHLHTADAYNESRAMVFPSDDEQIIAVRANGVENYIQLDNLTTGETLRYDGVNWGGGDNAFNFFNNCGSEYYYGGFSWVYYSFEYLQDEEVDAVAEAADGEIHKKNYHVILPWGTEQPWESKLLSSATVDYTEPTNDSNGRKWTEANYDDSAWETITGPLADAEGRLTNFHYTLVGKDNSYNLRRTFHMDSVPDMRYILRMHHDDGVLVYLNGELVVNDKTDGRSYEYTIPSDKFVVGENALAMYYYTLDIPNYLDYQLEMTEAVNVEQITLNETTIELAGGEFERLKATVTPREASDRIVWSVANPEIARVNSNGVVTALMAGTTTITAASRDDSSIKAECAITVTSDFKLLVPWGTDEPWEAKYRYWDSTDDYQAPEADANGNSWTVIDYDDSNWQTLTGPMANNMERVNYQHLWNQEHSCYTLRRVLHLDEKPTGVLHFCMKHDDDTRVYMNGQQVIEVPDFTYDEIAHFELPATALHEGDNMLAIYIQDTHGGWMFLDYAIGYRDSIPVTSITLNDTLLSQTVGQSVQLEATVLPENADDKRVVWSTADESIATVSDNGLVTIQGIGTTTVTATSVSNPDVTATCLVTGTNSGTATFDGLVATVSGDKTLDDAFEAVGGRSEAAKTIAAIRWNKETAMSESDLQGLNNPNLLVYVSAEALAPAGVQNVVVNGVAKSIVLTDTKEGNGNFCVPQQFTAESISYTRNFQQTTQIGVCRGWETIALPFDMQSIKHESKGDIVPFGSTENGTRFWLRRLMPDGLQSAQRIEANMPYVISMPNSEEYTYEFILAGRVTFSAQNATVPVTAAKVTALADSSITMEPTMVAVGRSSTVWALNVGQVRGSNVEGSVFERDYREVRPFEAYTVHRQDNSSSDDDNPSPRMIPLQNLMGSDATGIEDVRWQMSDGRDDHWYDLNGRKLQCKPTKKGVYIWNGHKRVVR